MLQLSRCRCHNNVAGVTLSRGKDMKSVKYLENLSEMTGMNDSQLAKALGLSHSTISLYKSGKRTMDDETSLKIAKLLNIDPMLVVAAANIDRAEKTGQRSLWEDFLMSRMATAAALLFLVSVNLFLTPGKAEAAPALGYSQVDNSHHFVLCQIQKIAKKKLGTILAWLERLLVGTALKAATT